MLRRAMRHDGGTWTWSTLFGFGSVPGSPAEVRAFLERRISLYVGLTLALWTVGTVADLLLRAVPSLRVGEPAFGRTFWLELTGTGLLAVLLLVVRRGEHPSGLLHAVDAAGTLGQAAIFSAILAEDSAQTRPELGPLLALAHILVARAAMVPSTALRSAIIGAAAGVALTTAVARCYLRDPLPEGLPSPWVFVTSTAIWMSITTVITAFISWVIYGLQRRVSQALALGQYTLEEKLGEGGMGIVYKARHALMKRPTAVKVLPPERAGGMAIARFEREVELTSRLSHPNTIAIHDFGRTDDGLFYYVMEHVDGIDLGALVRMDGPQPPGRVLLLLQQAAGALQEAHEAGLVHRDVKPENLLLCERGWAGDFLKVLDFGLAVAPAEMAATSMGGGIGTPLHMAPEVVSGREVDARSDLYSLGAVAYYLLTGTPVFEGATLVELGARHLHAAVEPPSERLGRPLPRALVAVVEACLAKSPADRPQSAAALLDALARCDDVPVWTAEDARRWWADRGAALRANVRSTLAAGSRGPSRLRVGLGRGQPTR